MLLQRFAVPPFKADNTMAPADDLIVMNRPSKHGKAQYQPLAQPVSVDLGEIMASP